MTMLPTDVKKNNVFTFFTLSLFLRFLNFFLYSERFCSTNFGTNVTQNGILMIFCVVCYDISNVTAMQRKSTDSNRVCKSYVILHWQTMNVFMTF